jgi:large subunit ribosomal protein L9
VKVIFLEDVANVARAGQTKEVADGYARNFLFPRKLAVVANSQAAAAIESHLKKIVKQRSIEEAEMTEIAKKITGVEITLKAKVGENDKLYGSVTGADIAESLSKAIDREIDKRKIELVEPIRQVGVHDVTVRFTHEITATATVIVMSDAEGAAVPVRALKAEVPVEEKPSKEDKKEKKAKKEKPAAEEAEKPPKEKKAKAEKAVKEVKQEEKPSSEDKPAPETKKEKKSKAKKTEESTEATKE